MFKRIDSIESTTAGLRHHIPRPSIIVGLLAIPFLAVICPVAFRVDLSAAAVEAGLAPEKKMQPEGVPAPLDKPQHWSAIPPLAEGLQVVHSWFIEFETPDAARKIPARVFLIERRANPSRIVCLGHEIEATEGFKPDFEVSGRYVKAAGPLYRVSLGNVEAMVRIVGMQARDR